MVVRKMKEKCKDAARMRREKERAEFVELSKLLPLPSSTTSQLDKASIIRLTSSYLRMRSAFPQGLGENWGTGRRHPNNAAANSVGSPNETNKLSKSSQLIRQPCSAQASQQLQQQQQIRELGSLILQTLDGFVFALHRDGKIMYISETASVHLGLPQIDLTGSSIFEYIHPNDHNDIHELLNLTERDKLELQETPAEETSGNAAQHRELGRSFCMRMKCILPKRNAGLVSNGYKAIHCSGYLKVRRIQDSIHSPNAPIGRHTTQQQASTLNSTTITDGSKTKLIRNETNATGGDNNLHHENGSGGFKQTHIAGTTTTNTPEHQWEQQWESYALVAVGHSLLPSASTEVRLGACSFMFRANLDLKLYFIEAPVIKFLGYEQMDMIGQSLYQFVYPADLGALEQAHRLLLDKGQVVSKYYRLMHHNGGTIWLQTYATLINNPRSMPKPQHIVSICFVIGENPHDESRLLTDNNQTIADSVLAAEMSDRDGETILHPTAVVATDRRIEKATNNQNEEASNLSQSSSSVSKSFSNSSRSQSVASTASGSTRKGSQTRVLSAATLSSTTHLKATRTRKLAQGRRNEVSASFIGKPRQLSAADPAHNRRRNPPGGSECQQFMTETEQTHLLHELGSHSPVLSALISQSASSNQFYTTNSVGSTRRPSEDTCSVVSSVASTGSVSMASAVTAITGNQHVSPADHYLPHHQYHTHRGQHQQQHHHHNHHHLLHQLNQPIHHYSSNMHPLIIDESCPRHSAPSPSSSSTTTSTTTAVVAPSTLQEHHHHPDTISNHENLINEHNDLRAQNIPQNHNHHQVQNHNGSVIEFTNLDANHDNHNQHPQPHHQSVFAQDQTTWSPSFSADSNGLMASVGSALATVSTNVLQSDQIGEIVPTSCNNRQQTIPYNHISCTPPPQQLSLASDTSCFSQTHWLPAIHQQPHQQQPQSVHAVPGDSGETYYHRIDGQSHNTNTACGYLHQNASSLMVQYGAAESQGAPVHYATGGGGGPIFHRHHHQVACVSDGYTM